ncbi:hypothetical protein [Acidiphilium acidophilum]|uniref:hypothetical protein n=1 Tax=Acidiphilium acidophilum TaxID=76588 RepID=UPI002E8E74C6|nr:hypothetical protein [Acidiphilium acidophilum]
MLFGVSIVCLDPNGLRLFLGVTPISRRCFAGAVVKRILGFGVDSRHLRIGYPRLSGYDVFACLDISRRPRRLLVLTNASSVCLIFGTAALDG